MVPISDTPVGMILGLSCSRVLFGRPRRTSIQADMFSVKTSPKSDLICYSKIGPSMWLMHIICVESFLPAAEEFQLDRDQDPAFGSSR